MLLSTDYENPPNPALARAIHQFAAAESVADIVACLRSHARGLVGSDGIAVILRDGQTCHYVAEEAIEPLWRGQRFPMSACVSGWAMLNNRTVVIPDLESDPRVPLESYARTSMRTIAIVPMGAPEPVAALGAYWCAFVEPDEATIGVLEDLARIATTAFARVAARTTAAATVD